MNKRVVGARYALLAALGLAATAVAFPGAGAGATTPGVVYGAETSQFEVVNAEVNPLRNRVVKFQFGWGADCVNGPAATPTTPNFIGFTEYRGPFVIKKNGTWSKTITEGGVDGSSKIKFVYQMKGLRTPTKMTGSIRVTFTETDLADAIIRTCDTGVIKYAALEKQRFGGLTVGQKNLIQVRTNALGNKISRVRWDWDGTCTAGPAAKPDTSLTAFQQDFITRLVTIKKNNTFDSGVISEGPFPDTQTGISRSFTTQVKGLKVGRTLKGTVTGGFTEIDTATGQVIRNCTSGPIKFSAKD